MAKTWYPVIDYLACVECGTCVSKCPHNVYDKAKAPSPVVRRPEDCIDHCHDCKNRCPVGAIIYVGDDTCWTPPNRGAGPKQIPCSCGSAEDGIKRVLVEYLYLDLLACDRCIGTEGVLDEVMITLTPALQLAGYEVEYEKIKMDTADIAKRYRFLSSPTIRVNGQDVCQSVAENSCGCCSDLSGTNVSCRIFEHDGKTYEVPPKDMLAQAILRAAYGRIGTTGCCDAYELPANLEAFYKGKESKSNCSCKGDCCLPMCRHR